MPDNEIALAKMLYADGEKFIPTEKEMSVINDVVHLFRETQLARNRNFQYFDNMSLTEYIDDSVLRFNTNVDERDGIEDWQAGVNNPITRNKVLAFHGKIMEALPIAVLSARGDEDVHRGMLLSNIYEALEDLDDYEELMSMIILETIVKGTGIGYEDVEYIEKVFRDVKGIGDDITVTENRQKITRLYGQNIPLEEFYPASVSIRRMQDQPFCYWREVIPFTKFKERFGHYKKSELVEGKRTYADDEDRPYYVDFIDANIPDGSVELIKYYDRVNDEYVIIANGIWINPINLKDGEGTKEEISPLPWNHKELPFWDIKFDLFGDFFYGKSLPDRLKSLQDVLNVLTNMLLDQSFLSIFPPLLTNGFDSIEDDYLRPGRRTPVDTQGLPINQAFQILETPTPSGWHQYILDYTKQIMEESSLDKVSQGIAGGGDRTTAQEIRVAASGVSAILQIFFRMINNGVKRKALLKTANFLQFGMNPDAPIIYKILGEGAGEEMNEAFTTLRINDTELSKGKRGTKLIEIYADKNQLPSRGSVKARAEISKKNSRSEIDIEAISPGYLRDISYDIKTIPNPKSEQTKDLDKALQVEKIEMYMTFFPEFTNKAELAAQTALKFGDDPARVLTEETFAPPQKEESSMAGQGNSANNQMRAAKGGEQALAEISAMGK